MSIRIAAISLLLLNAFSLVAFCAEPTSVALPPKEKFQLFLLIGQSNMAGRGKVAAQDKEVNPRVLTLNKAGQWAPAVDPIHFDKPGAAGVGLGKTFGLEIAKADPEITVGLIPCAVGGTSIDRWVPGAYDKATKSHPYDDALPRAKQALESGVLCGILWHQGESDANPEKAKVYEQKLDELVTRIRKELDAPEVPFLIGQLGAFAESPWNDAKKQIDAAQQHYVASHPHAAFVSAEGLTHKGDKVHFNAESYREFGKRYAKAYLDLLPAK